MTLLRKLFVAVAATAALVGCDNDLDINGIREEQSAIYSLIDPTQDTQWVRVHRVYLGQGDAEQSGQVADSIYYDTAFVRVYLDELVNGSVSKTIQLQPDFNSRAMQPGFFTTDEYRIYSTTEPITNAASYRLRVTRPDGSVATAFTPMVGEIAIRRPTQVEVISFTPTRDQPIEWDAAVNGRVYQPYVNFYYMEHTIGQRSDSTRKMVSYPLNVRRASNLSGTDRIISGLPYRGFMNFLAQNIEQNPNKLRWFRYVEVVMYGGSDDLNTFMNVNGPTTGLNLDKPEFTNIEGGTGLFASRNTAIRGPKQLSPANKDSLVVSPFTCGLNFAKVDLSGGGTPDTCICVDGGLICN